MRWFEMDIWIKSLAFVTTLCVFLHLSDWPKFWFLSNDVNVKNGVWDIQYN